MILTKMPVIRSTISFNEKNWDVLKNAKNKSKVVNKAISYFFASREFLKKKEIEFIKKELQHYEETGESYTSDEVFS